MDKKQIIISAVVAVVVAAGGGFYGGMQYKTNNTKDQLSQGRSGAFGGGANSTARTGQANTKGGIQNGVDAGSGFVTGQIASKDDTSITVKTKNGGSQIIFFSASTTVDKSVQGAATDLAVGEQVTANGTSSPDGSISAQNIQIRPAGADQGSASMQPAK